MNEDEEIQVELPPAAEPEITVEQLGIEAKPEATKTPEITPEEGIEKLKADLEAARTEAATFRVRAEHAENVAKSSQQQIISAQTEVQDSNLHMVNNAIAALEQKNEALKRNLRDALADQNVDAIAETQFAMSENSLQLAELRRGKEYIEKQPKPQVQPEIQQDPVEAFASTRSPRAAAWIRAHPQYVTNQNLFNKMVSAHNFVASDGVELDTDDYFDRIEGMLGLKQAPQAQTEQRMTAPPAAPPSRGGNGTGSRETIHLTREQVEAAEASGISPLEYAKQLKALRAEGVIH